MNRYLLIASSAEGIDYTEYPTLKDAQDAMRRAYETFSDKERDEETSSLGATDAVLCNGRDNVYYWNICTLEPREGEVVLEPVVENPPAIIGGFVECVIMPNGEVISRGNHLGWVRDFTDEDGLRFLTTKRKEV